MPRAVSEAERLFEDFLSRREAGEEPEFARVCAEHPEHEAELRRLWETSRAGESRAFSFFRYVDETTAEAARPGPVHAGERIADFVLSEPLARGGQGEVWVANQLSLGRRVALKLMLPERVGSRARELFLREARAGGRLSHPGIVAVYDQGTAKGHAWIAMELVEGACTLRDSLDEVTSSARLPDDYHRRGALLIARIAEALQAAHESGVIHRDVKPSNILITRDDRPKITDFGLARITDETAVSRTGDVMGTYAYMSPEQVAGKRSGIDHRTDVFSLGVVAYEVLSLRRPFTGGSAKEIFHRILTMEAPDLHSVRPDVPRELAVICAKALAKDPRERYPSMEALAADLRRFLADEPILARPPSPSRRVARWVRKHPTGRAVALTTGAAAVVLYLGTRPTERVPFTGPGHKLWNVTESPEDDGSPTFVGSRFLVFERRADERAPPGLWQVDLKSDLTPHAWSPAGVVCAAPSVSPDGDWLAYETTAGRLPDGSPTTAIVLRDLEVLPDALRWPEEEYERLEYETSVGGVAWSRDSRFVYTLDLGDGQALMLHEMGTPGREDRELLRAPRGPLDHIQACFSPDDDRVLVAREGGIETVMLDPRATPPPPRGLDCGIPRDLVCLADGSILFARQASSDVSTRLYRLSERGTTRMGELEKHLIGGYTELALSADRSMLALVSRVETSSLYTCSPPSYAPVELRPRYFPVNPVWTPAGRVLYCANTPDGLRAFVFDPETGVDRPLELDLPFLAPFEGNYQLDHPAFSQNGAYLVLRAKGERVNERCDPQEWIVVSPWPVDRGAVLAAPMTGRILYPHVTDDGARVIWCEEHADGASVFSARLADGRALDVERRMRDAEWPARISGDGRWIAAASPDGARIRLRVVEWDGAEVLELRDGEVNIRPMWMPTDSGGGHRLAHLHWDPNASDRIAIRAVAMDDPESVTELCAVPAPSTNPAYATYDPRAGRLVYAISHTKHGNLWLSRPDDERTEP